ncbi:hypothetical protein EI171_20430 [Bradyrhizobium sp. LCT2]|uniref:hypothetical protein n=1 Tax=Bradyrhizobium sp. LCT2 TaxID=2493093 RepID=UPI0013744141|nr:hypothetical protein [Bradyrhizobium sp. LCT2]QHP69443.1 hypothetical protein EI171_20430 [Bradyrhizobium sp. LCT2]
MNRKIDPRRHGPVRARQGKGNTVYIEIGLLANADGTVQVFAAPLNKLQKKTVFRVNEADNPKWHKYLVAAIAAAPKKKAAA